MGKDKGNKALPLNQINRLKGAAQNTKTEGKSIRPMYLGIAAVMILVVAVVLIIKSSGTSEITDEDILAGRQYILNLEAKDVQATTEKINVIKKRKLREALEDGDLNIWSQFYDYLIMGDSRAVGFWFYDLLEESRCITAAGSRIDGIPEQIEQVKAINASNIFLAYGVNDLGIGLYSSPEEYAKAMDETVQLIQDACPNATIYINSILPCQDFACQDTPIWSQIPEYNAAVKKMAEEKGYHYIDNTDVVAQHSELYDVDGIHLMKPFYDYWGANILVEMST